MGYIHNVILAFDQLANAFCGGNPDNTISARVGYFAQVNQYASKYYWRTVETVIDFTYWPLDGPYHCRQAFEADPEEIFNDNNSDFFPVFYDTYHYCCLYSCIYIIVHWMGNFMDIWSKEN